MIKLTKTGKKAFLFEMDMVGVKEMINYLKNIIRGENIDIVGIIDTDKRKEFVIEKSDDEFFAITHEKIILKMDNEELDYFIYRLQESLSAEVFYPAELCERNGHKCKEDIVLYVKYIAIDKK